MSEDDKKLHETIGYIRADLKNVGKKVDCIDQKVSDTNRAVTTLTAKAVTKDECEKRSLHYTDKVEEIKLALANKQTRQEVPRITGDMVTPLTAESIAQELQKLNGQRKSLLLRIRDNALAATIIISFVSLLVVGAIKAAYFVVGFHKAYTDNTSTIKKELKTIKKSAVNNGHNTSYMTPRLDSRVDIDLNK
jgi:hypothetical protein